VTAPFHARESGASSDVRAIAAPDFQADDAVAALAVSLTAADQATTDADALSPHVTYTARALSAAVGRANG
jgi:DNA-binding IclR family transcriptional regulator